MPGRRLPRASGCPRERGLRGAVPRIRRAAPVGQPQPQLLRPVHVRLSAQWCPGRHPREALRQRPRGARVGHRRGHPRAERRAAHARGAGASPAGRVAGRAPRGQHGLAAPALRVSRQCVLPAGAPGKRAHATRTLAVGHGGLPQRTHHLADGSDRADVRRPPGPAVGRNARRGAGAGGRRHVRSRPGRGRPARHALVPRMGLQRPLRGRRDSEGRRSGRAVCTPT